MKPLPYSQTIQYRRVYVVYKGFIQTIQNGGYDDDDDDNNDNDNDDGKRKDITITIDNNIIINENIFYI